MAAPGNFVGDGIKLPPAAIINVAPIPDDVISVAKGSNNPSSAMEAGARSQNSGTIDTDYTIKHYYETDMHRFMMGVTSPGAGPAIVQLSEKTLLWICDWTAASLGAHPIIPDSVPQQIDKWVLLDEHYSPVSVVAVTDGVTPLYRISGTYVYACLSPNTRTVRDVVFPVGAWMVASEFDRAIDETYVQKGFTDSTQQQGAGGGQSQGGAAGQYTRG